MDTWKAPALKMPRGRPTKYSQEIADRICELIATTSRGLRSICKEVGISTFTIVTWLSDESKKEFSIQYARAKEQQADILAEEIIRIADKVKEYTERSECIGGEGSYTTATTKDNYNRARLQIDARKWVASKLAPKKYGDKVDVTSDGKALSPMVIDWNGNKSDSKTN